MTEPTLIEDALPGPGDRDLHGRCWWGHGLVSDPQTGEPYQPSWSLAEMPYGCDTHWLPARALPIAHSWPLPDPEDPSCYALAALDEDGQQALTAADRNPSLCR